MRRALLLAWLAGLVLPLSLGGCAEAGRRVVVSPEEFARYRRFRVAETVLTKLGTGFDYLGRYERGAYGDEVRAWVTPAARHSLERGWNDEASLEAFLRAVPSGQEASRAAARLVELELTHTYRARHERAFDEKVRGIEGKLAAAERGRRTLVADVIAWTRRLAAIRSWGGRTSDLNDELIYAYRLKEPAARCTEEACTKTMSVAYSVPEGKVQSSREAIYDVNLALVSGGVRAARITGPELFTRLGEAVSVRAVTPTDILGRAEAIGQAAQLLSAAVETVLPSSRCSVEAVSPVVLHRACDGVTLRVISAVDLGEEDRVVVEPTPAPVAVPALPPAPRIRAKRAR